MGEIETAVERLTGAIRTYASVVRESPRLPKDVIAAANQVQATGLALQDAIFEESGWHIRLFETDDEPDEEVAPEDDPILPPDGQGLAVRIRADFVVTDPDRLLAAGRAAYRQLWPEDPELAAEQRVDRLEVAVGELLHLHPAEPLAGMNLTELGLAEAGTALAIDRVDQVLDNRDGFPDYSDDPFTLT